MHEVTGHELASWDELIRQNPDGGEALQTRAWGEFKGRHGWTPHYIMFDEPKVAALFLGRQVRGLGEVLYCPKGPGVAFVADLTKIGATLKAARPPAFVIKAEPEIVGSGEVPGWVKAPFDVHISQATYKLDLGNRPDDLMLGFKQKTRYNIRLAEKHGVTVKAVETSQESVDSLYGLIEATQKRGGFAIRSKDYCQDYWQAMSEAGQGQIFLAEHEGQPIAGAFVTVLGNKAWYKDGGSSREHSQLMAPYLLQWEIIKWLIERGVTRYDLVGVPRIGDETSPLKGLVQFKSGFNGQYQEFIGTWDLPLTDWKYKLWRSVGERATLKASLKLKGELWY